MYVIVRVEGISFSFLFSLLSLFCGRPLVLWLRGGVNDGGAVGRGYGSTGINFKGISSFFNSFFFPELFLFTAVVAFDFLFSFPFHLFRFFPFFSFLVLLTCIGLTRVEEYIRLGRVRVWGVNDRQVSRQVCSS